MRRRARRRRHRRGTADEAPQKKSPAKGAAPAAKKTASAKKAASAAAAPAKKKTAAKKTAPANVSATKPEAEKQAAKKQAAKKSASKKPAATKPSASSEAKGAGANGLAGGLAVRADEKPWTAAEIKDVRATLEHDRSRLLAEIAATEADINHLLRGGGEGAGNDQADVGSNTFERDHEMSMAKNARDNLELVEAALARIDQGDYGVCESCGQPIGKMRLQAFPRATLCMECKQREERR